MREKQNVAMDYHSVLDCIRSDYERIPPEMAKFKESLAHSTLIDRRQATKNALLLGYGERALLEMYEEILKWQLRAAPLATITGADASAAGGTLAP